MATEPGTYLADRIVAEMRPPRRPGLLPWEEARWVELPRAWVATVLLAARNPLGFVSPSPGSPRVARSLAFAALTGVVVALGNGCLAMAGAPWVDPLSGIADFAGWDERQLASVVGPEDLVSLAVLGAFVHLSLGVLEGAFASGALWLFGGPSVELGRALRASSYARVTALLRWLPIPNGAILLAHAGVLIYAIAGAQDEDPLDVSLSVAVAGLFALFALFFMTLVDIAAGPGWAPVGVP